MNKSQKKCRFLYETCVVLKRTTYDFAGGYDHFKLCKPKKDIDFPIEGYEKHNGCYDILVEDAAKGIRDGGYREWLINIPKFMICFTENE